MKETPETECSYETAWKGARWKATICCSLSCSHPTLAGRPFLFLFVLRAVSACANNSLKCFSWLLNFRRQLTFCKEKRGFTLLNHSLPPRRLRSRVFCLLLVILLSSDGVIKLVQKTVCSEAARKTLALSSLLPSFFSVVHLPFALLWSRFVILGFLCNSCHSWLIDVMIPKCGVFISTFYIISTL